MSTNRMTRVSTQRHPGHRAEHGGDDPDHQRLPRAVDQPGQHVAAQLVDPQREAVLRTGDRSLPHLRQQRLLQRVARRQQRREGGDEQEDDHDDRADDRHRVAAQPAERAPGQRDATAVLGDLSGARGEGVDLLPPAVAQRCGHRTRTRGSRRP
jgi:hypothetical protein